MQCSSYQSVSKTVCPRPPKSKFGGSSTDAHGTFASNQQTRVGSVTRATDTPRLWSRSNEMGGVGRCRCAYVRCFPLLALTSIGGVCSVPWTPRPADCLAPVMARWRGSQAGAAEAAAPRGAATQSVRRPTHHQSGRHAVRMDTRHDT
eukprot:113648-Chlamydomonas_euryale.AAC.3